MGVENIITDAHKITAKVSGQLSLSLSRRNVSKTSIDIWIRELDRAARIIEQLKEKRS